MSLATWKKEFYPIEASEVKKKDALDHSIRKWRGLSAASLKKHRVGKDLGDRTLFDMGENVEWFTINTTRCALCKHYYISVHGHCTGCPLFTVNKGTRCDEGATGEANSPYHHFIKFNDPKPMLKLLRKAKKHLTSLKGGKKNV